MAAIPVMSEAQWARIIAKAYLEKTTTNFKNTLERDPKAAVDYVRQNGGDLPNMDLPAPGAPLRLMNLDYSNWVVLDSVAIDLLAIFKGSSHVELQEIFNKGTLDGQPVELPPGEWVTDKGLIRLFLHSGPPTISLTDWMRIYAYVWDQFRFPPGNQAIRELFEEDPAQTLLSKIAGPLNLSYKKGDPLFTLGGPDDPPGNLADIKADKGAKQFRHRIRLCC